MRLRMYTHGIAVEMSVCPSNACTVTKRKKLLHTFYTV